MAAPPSLQPPTANRRGRNPRKDRPADDDRQTQFKRQIAELNRVSRSSADRRVAAAARRRPAPAPVRRDSLQRVQDEARGRTDRRTSRWGRRSKGSMKNPAAKSPQEATSRFTTLPPPDGDPELLKELGAAHVTYRAKTPPSPIASFILSWVLPLLVMMGLWSLVGRNLSTRAGGGIFGVGKSKATEVTAEEVGVTFKDVGGADEAIARAAGNHPVPEDAAAVRHARRTDSERRAARRTARDGQDADREGHRGRSRRPVLRDERIGVRRDVRRRRRGARARSVRAGPSRRARDRVHRRDRRDRAEPRRRGPAGHQRRARADAESTPRRDRRLQDRRRESGDHHGRHEPARDPRPGAAAGGTVRSPGRPRAIPISRAGCRS